MKLLVCQTYFLKFCASSSVAKEASLDNYCYLATKDVYQAIFADDDYAKQ